jgi:hypothetical protein
VSRHPSELALEAYLFERDQSPVAGHVAGCEHCRARLARMEREGENFRRFVLPATLDAVLAKNSPGRRRKAWTWLLALAPAAAAVALVVALRPAEPPDGYVGIKGGMNLVAYVNAPGGANAVRDGQAVPPSAALRFMVNPGGSCNLWIVSVDESGQVSRIYPAAGNDGAPVSGKRVTLPGGAMLDGRTGLERFYGVCSPGPLAYEDVVKCVRSSVHGATDVRKGPALSGLPKGARQVSLLVEKRP